MNRKLLMLGASHFQIPVIKYAKKAGYNVITADYLPENPGHKFSDAYYNVSTIDKEAILKLAKSLSIDGILSYASDPGTTTAAYVSEKLDLPGNPYESVKILQQKDLFRKFLKENNFNVPASKSFGKIEDGRNYASKLLEKYVSIIIKPVDSSGSKGVTKINSLNDFESAFNLGLQYSFKKKVVVEQYIKKTIYEMDGDGFVWNGKLQFRCFGNQHNDIRCNPYVPSGISFPYVQGKSIQQKAHNEIERALNLLDMKVGGLNIEYLTDENEEVFILEIGPRSGGNLIPDVIKYSTGVDLIAYSVEGALGKDCSDLTMKNSQGFYASYIIHSIEDGILNSININDELKENIIEENIWKKKNDSVIKFNGSNGTIGTMILKFSSSDEMIYKMDNMNKYIKVELN
ncbi:MAG: ATP-grasp domain-containing protein [Melioribacteraceae bacterium]